MEKKRSGYQNRPRHDQGRPKSDKLSLDNESKKIITSIIQSGFTKSGMDLVEKIGGEIKKITSSQIRIAYGEVTRLKMKEEVPIGEVLMLKPKMAYAAGRARSNKDKYRYLKEIISHAVDLTCDEKITKEEQSKRFKNLASLFEAILAFHKASGGK